MRVNPYDAIVVGGGPGGSTVAGYLARSGRSVLVLEKERFPRFHIGESLLPYNHAIFADLGVLPKLESMGLMRKTGAQFHLGSGIKSAQFVFREGAFTRHHQAFQVERATFDHCLLDHARSLGAEVREQWTFDRHEVLADRVVVHAHGPGPASRETLHARFLIDASGQSNVTAVHSGLREFHPNLRKIAVFGHFEGVKLDPGDRAGDTVIVRLHDKWFWIIPLSPTRVSVGLVMNTDAFRESGASPEDLFARWVESSPPVRNRMGAARREGPLRIQTDFSYRNRQLTSPRLLRVGDAAGFIDPIFSAGVYLAMYSGKHAASAVHRSLAAGDDGNGAFPAYGRRVRRGIEIYREMVEGYYTEPFMELFLEPRPRLQLPAAVNAILAGEIEAPWRMRWRLRVFHLLVRIQRHWPLVPRIAWTPRRRTPSPSHAAP